MNLGRLLKLLSGLVVLSEIPTVFLTTTSPQMSLVGLLKLRTGLCISSEEAADILAKHYSATGAPGDS